MWTSSRNCPADTVQFNEIGKVEFELYAPIFCDPYERNRVDRQLHPDRPNH